MNLSEDLFAAEAMNAVEKDLMEMKVTELKEELASRNEPVSGNKAWLRRRLHTAIGGVKGGVGGVKGGVEGGAQVSILGKFVDKPAGKYSGGNKRKLCFRVSLRDPSPPPPLPPPPSPSPPPAPLNITGGYIDQDGGVFVEDGTSVSLQTVPLSKMPLSERLSRMPLSEVSQSVFLRLPLRVSLSEVPL
eukprot:jgi/Chrpa1/2262/Chrysochromulina_OHIO_Genome00011902-RA